MLFSVSLETVAVASALPTFLFAVWFSTPFSGSAK
jgi:hypothetical protein